LPKALPVPPSLVKEGVERDMGKIFRVDIKGAEEMVEGRFFGRKEAR